MWLILEVLRYIIVFHTQHNEPINEDQKDILHTLIPCLACFVYVLVMTPQLLVQCIMGPGNCHTCYNALWDLAIVTWGAMHYGTWQLVHVMKCIMGPGNCFTGAMFSGTWQLLHVVQCIMGPGNWYTWCNALWDLVIVSRGAMHYGTWQLFHGVQCIMWPGNCFMWCNA